MKWSSEVEAEGPFGQEPDGPVRRRSWLMAFDFFNKGRGRTVEPGRVPPGQAVTEKWPVLHYGGVPSADLTKWDFRVFGLVEQPLRFNWQEFQKLPRGKTHCDIHCVTRWSRLDND